MMIRKRALCFLVALIVCVIARAPFGGAALQQKAQPPESPPLVRFAAIGDMGTGDKDQIHVARAMAAYHAEHPYDTVLMLGDNIYPLGNPKDLGKKFEQPYAELLKRNISFYAVLGNHDVFKGRQAEMNYPLFHMGGRAYYSFVKGDGLVEFFALDTTDFDSKQQEWLEGALASSKAQWKLVYTHHPLYSSGKRHGSDVKLRAILEPLLVKYGVAVVLSGHDHIYERTKPQQGIQYFVCGFSGKLRSGNLDRQTPFFEFGNDQEVGFMAVEVTADQLIFQAINADGRILDSGVIRPHPIVRSATAK